MEQNERNTAFLPRTILSLTIKILICLALCAVIVIPVFSYQADRAEKQKDLEEKRNFEIERHSAEMEEWNALKEEERRLYLEKEQTYSVFQRWAEGMAVEVVYCGDRIGYGKGVSSPAKDSFRILLKNRYAELSHSNTIGTRICADIPQKDNFESVYNGLQNYWKLWDMDLCILTMGTETESDDFAREYEEIVRSIKQADPSCDVLCVIAHGISDVRGGQIAEIADYYGFLTVDMRDAFAESEEPLENEEGLPNEAGNKLYADHIFAVLREAVEMSRSATALPELPFWEYKELHSEASKDDAAEELFETENEKTEDSEETDPVAEEAPALENGTSEHAADAIPEEVLEKE